MKAICAWCDKTLRDDHSDDGITHGICEKCLESFRLNGDLPSPTMRDFSMGTDKQVFDQHAANNCARCQKR